MIAMWVLKLNLAYPLNAVLERKRVHPETSSRITTLVSPAQLLFPLTRALFIQMKLLLSDSWMFLVSRDGWTCCKSRWSHLFLPGLILTALKCCDSCPEAQTVLL